MEPIIMKHLALTLAAASTLVLFSAPSEARPFGRGHGFAGHHGGFHGVRHGFRGYRAVGVRRHYRGFGGYRGIGLRPTRFGYGRHDGRYGYRRGYRGLGLAAGLGLGLAATAARPAYYGGYDGYGSHYAPVGYGYGYGYGAGRPACTCGY
jgi:hypothetical protein